MKPQKSMRQNQQEAQKFQRKNPLSKPQYRNLIFIRNEQRQINRVSREYSRREIISLANKEFLLKIINAVKVIFVITMAVIKIATMTANRVISRIAVKDGITIVNRGISVITIVAVIKVVTTTANRVISRIAAKDGITIVSRGIFVIITVAVIKIAIMIISKEISKTAVKASKEIFRIVPTIDNKTVFKDRIIANG